ncbi:putative uncharacterized protein [Firmicutes bacterium CAG:137]|nr:putative uncharacterized protein [Firmicutes bacterium CAG:137]
MEKKKRIAALLLAVTVLLVMLYSALFIAAEADHDCVGENCPICYQINVCQNALKNLSLAVCAVAFAAAFTYALCRSISACADVIPSYTLVSLKVKLTD